jgi:hypothetical protein
MLRVFKSGIKLSTTDVQQHWWKWSCTHWSRTIQEVSVSSAPLLWLVKTRFVDRINMRLTDKPTKDPYNCGQ